MPQASTVNNSGHLSSKAISMSTSKFVRELKALETHEKTYGKWVGKYCFIHWYYRL